MYKVDLSGKTAVVFGIANQRSIAWSIAKILSDAGAKIIATYQNERVEDSVSKLTSQLNNAITVECDVSDEIMSNQLLKQSGEIVKLLT